MAFPLSTIAVCLGVLLTCAPAHAAPPADTAPGATVTQVGPYVYESDGRRLRWPELRQGALRSGQPERIKVVRHADASLGTGIALVALGGALFTMGTVDVVTQSPAVILLDSGSSDSGGGIWEPFDAIGYLTGGGAALAAGGILLADAGHARARVAAETFGHPVSVAPVFGASPHGASVAIVGRF